MSSGKAHVDRLVTKYFLKTLELLSKRNIKVYLVRFPLNRYYYQRVESIMDINSYEATLVRALRDYHIVKFLDYSTLLDAYSCHGYDCENFCDFDHLDSAGADIISRLLAREIH